MVVYTDGGSRGNPGPSALGVVIKDGEQLVKTFGEFLGVQTNNYAEYTALIRALEESIELGAEEVTVRMDSELVVKQMKGLYKIKHPNIIPLAERVVLLLSKFKRYSFEHVRRELNKEADAEVNKALDAHK